MKRSMWAGALVCCTLLAACRPAPGGVELVSFVFRAADNLELDLDVVAEIADSSVAAITPFTASRHALVAAFVTTGVDVRVDGVAQVSGQTENDFSAPVDYTVTGEDGTEITYSVAVGADTSESPVLLSPGNESDVYLTRPLLDWTAVQGAASYEVQTAATAGGLDGSAAQAVTSPGYQPATDLADAETLAWRVRALNGDGVAATWSDARSLTVRLPPRAGLVGEWLFNGGVADTSTAANHGTLNGPVLAADRLGAGDSAYDFDGVNDYVAVGTVAVTAHGSISAWVRFALGSVATQEQQFLLSWCSGLGAAANLQVGYLWQAKVFDVWSLASGSGHFLESTVVPADLAWYHLVGTWDVASSTYNLYLDGVLEVTRSDPGQAPVNPTPISSGFLGYGYFNATDSYLGGRLDDIRIYDRVLSSAEVGYLFHEGNYSP